MLNLVESTESQVNGLNDQILKLEEQKQTIQKKIDGLKEQVKKLSEQK